MAGVGEGPIGNCIVGEPGSCDTLEGYSGRPDSKWQERPFILLSRPTQDSSQSESTRGKGIGGTYAEGKTNTPLKAGIIMVDVKVPRLANGATDETEPV